MVQRLFLYLKIGGIVYRGGVFLLLEAVKVKQISAVRRASGRRFAKIFCFSPHRTPEFASIPTIGPADNIFLKGGEKMCLEMFV